MGIGRNVTHIEPAAPFGRGPVSPGPRVIRNLVGTMRCGTRRAPVTMGLAARVGSRGRFIPHSATKDLASRKQGTGARVFERFVRLDPPVPGRRGDRASDWFHPSSRFMRSHDGTVEVATRPSGGAVFTLTTATGHSRDSAGTDFRRGAREVGRPAPRRFLWWTTQNGTSILRRSRPIRPRTGTRCRRLRSSNSHTDRRISDWRGGGGPQSPFVAQ